jgi:hypothetical protein
MIEIELRDKEGIPYLADHPHPEFVDFPQRTGRARADRRTIVGVHPENAAVRVIAKLANKNALSVYSDLTRARAQIAAGWPHREDGLAILDLLIPWSREHGEGRFFVSGAPEQLPDGPFVLPPAEPRFSERSFTVVPFDAGSTWLDPADRRPPSLDAQKTLADDADLQSHRDFERAMGHRRWNPDDKSSGSSGPGRTRAKSAAGGKTYLAGPVDNSHLAEEADRQVRLAQIDAGTYRPRASGRPKGPPTRTVRLAAVVADAIEREPGTKDLMAVLASAITSGVTYAEALAKMTELGRCEKKEEPPNNVE